MEEVEVRKYTITGLVDYTDEQGNIVGQFEVGSVQELPVFVGDKAVAAGQAEVFEGDEEVEEEAAGGDDDADTTTTDDSDVEAPAGDETTDADPSDVPGADDDNADLDEEESDEDESEDGDDEDNEDEVE